MLQPLYVKGKKSRCQLNRGLDCFGEKENLLMIAFFWDMALRKPEN